MKPPSPDIKMICPDCLGCAEQAQPEVCSTCDGSGLIVIVQALKLFVEGKPARLDITRLGTAR